MTAAEAVAKGRALARKTVPDSEMQAFAQAFESYGGVALVEMKEADKVIKIAQAIRALEDAFTPAIMEQIMDLQGRQVGFRTDLDRQGGYTVGIVKEVMIEGVMYGARPTGNEINIIADRCYLTKQHFARKVKELPGLSDLEITIGVPKIEIKDQKGNGVATVNCRAKWKMNGAEMTIGYDEKDPCNLAVKVYDGKGGGADQAIGKCEKRLLYRVWQRATGSTISLPEGDVEAHEVQASVVATESAEPSTKAQAVANRIAERKGGNGKQQPAPAPEIKAEAKEEEVQEREPGADDEAPAIPPAKVDPPPSYQRLLRAYDNHQQLVDKILAEHGFGTLLDVDPAVVVKFPEQLAKLQRVAAKVMSEIAK